MPGKLFQLKMQIHNEESQGKGSLFMPKILKPLARWSWKKWCENFMHNLCKLLPCKRLQNGMVTDFYYIWMLYDFWTLRSYLLINQCPDCSSWWGLVLRLLCLELLRASNSPHYKWETCCSWIWTTDHRIDGKQPYWANSDTLISLTLYMLQAILFLNFTLMQLPWNYIPFFTVTTAWQCRFFDTK